MDAQKMGQAMGLAAPVMLAYVSIGIPCGVMEAQVGFTPLTAFLFSATYYSGAGQFMVPNLWMAGASLFSIVLSVSFVTTRQLLYSTAFAPYLAGEGRMRTLGFAALVTDETFGVNLDRYASDEGWDSTRAIVVNVACMLSWALANALGAALGSVVDMPIDVLSFGMTAIFICLLMGQPASRTTAVVAGCAAAGVALCKLLGWGGASIFVGAVLGVVCGVLFEEGTGHDVA